MTATPQNLVYEMLQGELILVTVQRDNATPAEWDHYLNFFETLANIKALRMVVYVQGAAPSVANQQRIAKIVRGRDWPCALISSSIALRFVVSTFSLINRNIRYFTPTQVPAALLHIGCTKDTSPAVEQVLDRLRQAS
jgi:hypothetical protein